ncbi:MAG TPA: response regulator, partial [Gemmatimonadales bacterium]|nr:response regulator [Gemmatimonadales bacterium]
MPARQPGRGRLTGNQPGASFREHPVLAPPSGGRPAVPVQARSFNLRTPASSDQTSPPLRILVLEDAPMDAELLEYEIGRAGIGFIAERVHSRESFCAALGDFRPDLILSDYTLPGFDGMAALQLARQHAPGVPFIMVTGSINEETAVGCMRAGADDYLLKSNLARIGPAISAALERQQIRAERRRTEAALRRSEANLRAIFNNTLQDFVLLDRSGAVL